MSVIRSTLDTNSEVYQTATSTMNTKLAEIEVEHAKALAGGGEKYTERHHKRGSSWHASGSSFCSIRIHRFSNCAPRCVGSDFPVGASTVVGIGVVEGVECLIVANDPTVRGGTSNPWTLRKGFRANDIAMQNRLPVISLVESGGADLPTQKEVFIPGGRMFRDLTQLSAAGIPTIALVFGNSTAAARTSRACPTTS
ncbi:hypothetical protein GCM10020255_063180 [Rhodococcus baikonurensis]